MGEHPCLPRQASFSKVSFGETPAVKDESVSASLVYQRLANNSCAGDEACACAQLIIHARVHG